MERDELVALVLGRIRPHIPGGMQLVADEKDNMKFKVLVQAKQDTGLMFDLTGLWRNVQHGDFHMIDNFVSAIKDELTRVENNEGDVKPVNMDVLFPVIRTRSHEHRMIQEPFDEHLVLCFVENHEHTVQYVTLDYLQSGISVEQLKKTAIQNLRKRGWIRPVERQSLRYGSKLMVYDHADPYHYQFFDPPLRQKYLSDTFLLSLATHSTTIVVVPPKGEFTHTDDLSAAQDFALRIARASPKPLDPKFRLMRGRRH